MFGKFSQTCVILFLLYGLTFVECAAEESKDDDEREIGELVFSGGIKNNIALLKSVDSVERFSIGANDVEGMVSRNITMLLKTDAEDRDLRNSLYDLFRNLGGKKSVLSSQIMPPHIHSR